MKAAFVNGLHNTVAPQSTPYPFVVFQIVDDTPSYNFSDDFENTLVQFRLVSKTGSSTQLNGMFTALKAFDFAVLTVADYTTVSMARNTAIKSKNEDEEWVYLVLYKVLLQKDVSVR